MLKERTPRISRRTLFKLGLVVGAGIAATEIEKRLPFLQSPTSPEFSPKEIERLRDIDVVFLFNPGGWGYTSLEDNPSWQEILFKTKEKLENRGYKAEILQEVRRHGPFLPPLVSVTNTVSKIEQLRESLPELKIVLAGHSTGASFVERILKSLPKNNQILAIEAVRPFEKSNPLVAPERTLVIENPEYDPVQEGNFGEILRGCLPPAIFIGDGGDIGIGRIRFDFRFPGHDSCCPWNPEVASAVEKFLDAHFPPKR